MKTPDYIGKIVPTGHLSGYIEAFYSVKDKGGLPFNVLHDDVLVRSDAWKQLTRYHIITQRKGYYPAWAREFLIYPEPNGKFTKGKDVMDTYKDKIAGMSWIFPASSVPYEAWERIGIGLFVNPQNVEVINDKVIVEADSKAVVILAPFLQKKDWGKVDEATRIPLALVPDSDSFDAVRYLWRTDGIGVRPLVRDSEGPAIDGRFVFADCWRDLPFGVGLVGREDLKLEG